MSSVQQIEDPTTAYARAAVAGEIVAGTLVRLACERHLRDLDHGGERGLRFDMREADRAFQFFRFLRHTEGQFAGKRFELILFQKFIIGSIFGWKNADGYRRFRTVYAEIGKGNGKTPMAAGIGLKGFLADGESGAQIYSAAVSRDQANLSFTDAVNMAKSSPDVAKRIEFNKGNMAVPATRSFFRPLSADQGKSSGQRVHVAIVDELHEHPSAAVLDKISAGVKARLQALLVEITNSGFDRNSVCWREHEYAAKVLKGILEDDSLFAYVCQLDPCAECAAAGREAPNEACKNCDDWRDEANWIKANPGLDEILPREYLRKQVREAVGMPSKQNIVRRLNFCEWTESAVRWLPMTHWDQCPNKINPELLRGRECFVGVDLSTKIDLTASVSVFPPTDDDPNWVWMPRFYVPKDNVRERERRDNVPYRRWIDAGFIEATEGDVVDYAVIEKRIEEDSKIYSIQEIGFDQWNATYFATNMTGKGFKMVEVRQGKPTMNEPSKELEALVQSHRINHGGHPVLRWMASNVVADRDVNDNIMPAKDSSTGRIDGIVAGLIAMARAIRNLADAPSIYETRGILRI